MDIRNIALGTALLGLAACVQPPAGPSPAAIAALPPGVDKSFLIKDANGCYGIGIEQSEPQTGVALLDATGKQVCDPQ
ncbi:hypothetical protein [Oceaniglobus roseus]|uniref:hypothetical protein n=1 Tax=Oceaniglobus roseus TaxID=1737570 RepID=UPI000C7E8B4B|nr:hypothetical protein [Kandeliimicrobium roseum]